MRALPLIGKRTFMMLIGLVVAVLFFAWFDGGEEPLHQIEQPIPLPETSE